MAGSVLTVGALTLSVAMIAGVGLVGGAHVAAQRLAAASDGAALAAADAASGAVSGVPCERAAQIAESAGARIVSCSVDELVATVRVEGTYAGLSFTAHARAGPPPDDG